MSKQKNQPKNMKSSSKMLQLTLLLICSGGLNIFLIIYLFSSYFSQAQLPPYIDRRPVIEGEEQPSLAVKQSFQQVMRTLMKLPFNCLLDCLHRTELVENGYRIRDLALSILISRHHFDGERALAKCGNHKQFKTMQIAENGLLSNGKTNSQQFVLISGLTDEHYQSIIHFANTEKWPLTPNGIFLLMKEKAKGDEGLKEAFSLTPHYFSAHALLSKSNKEFNVDTLIEMLLNGSWETLNEFHCKQMLSQDLSEARRQRFLLDYVEHSSTAACNLMLQLDGDFALRKLDNDHALAILKKASPSEETTKYALSLLKSPRNDAVWEKASEYLYENARLPKPQQFDKKAALALFDSSTSRKEVIVNKEPIANNISISPPKPFTQPMKNPPSIPATITAKRESYKGRMLEKSVASLYIIQSGDSLWKIAKRFHVDIDAIRQCNHLLSDTLKPGTPLAIPLP